MPILVPFIYVQLKLRRRAYNTAAAHLRAVQAFYAYAETRGLDVDEAILACQFESIRALSNVLDRLFLTIELAHSELLPTLCAHDFRHTFADRFLAYLVEQRGYDLERATDELRRVCGWSETSAMPRRYASRYLAESANLHNAQRASAAWSRIDS